MRVLQQLNTELIAEVEEVQSKEESCMDLKQLQDVGEIHACGQG